MLCFYTAAIRPVLFIFNRTFPRSSTCGYVNVPQILEPHPHPHRNEVIKETYLFIAVACLHFLNSC